MNNDVHYTKIMLEFEKLTTKLDKLEKELADFKELVFPLHQTTINVRETTDPTLYSRYQEAISSLGKNGREGVITNFYTKGLIVGEESNWLPWFTPLSNELKGATNEHHSK